MKINEAEELLGISKANIRFYEKEGLLTPRRGENRYRDYSEEDLDRLREIVILRKLGISVQDIKQILDGELMLGDAMTANIANLEEQISQLTGALKLSRQIREEKLTKLDTPRYWEIIHDEEQRGGKFFEVMSEFWTGSEWWNGVGWMFHHMVLTEPGDGWRKMVRNGAYLTLFVIVVRLLRGHSIELVDVFHIPIVVCGVALLHLPVYLLGRRSRKAAEIGMHVIGISATLFLLLLFVFIIILFFSSRYHFWY